MRAEIIAEHRADLFSEGAARAGFEVVHYNRQPQREDILVCWNRKKINQKKILSYENAGARVIIAENGYIGYGDDGHKLTALAIGHHMGAGRWYTGLEPRWKRQEIKIRPWRKPGKEIVILAQRGIGESMDAKWAMRLQDSLKRKTDRHVRLRFHPGKKVNALEPDLDDAWAVVTWGSAAGLKAIAYGVPAFHLMPEWIGQLGAKFGVDDLENPERPDRENLFHAVGWAQWTHSEIKSGESFRFLLDNDAFWHEGKSNASASSV